MLRVTHAAKIIAEQLLELYKTAAADWKRTRAKRDYTVC